MEIIHIKGKMLFCVLLIEVLKQLRQLWHLFRIICLNFNKNIS